MPFDALIFDVGGVIVPHDNEQLYRLLAGRCRPAPLPSAIADAARDPRYERGELPIAHLHRRLRHEAGYAPDWDAFVADWCSHLGLDLAMLDYLEHLAARRRVLLFSNTNHEHWQHLLRLSAGRLGRFEAHLSHEMGDAKPSPSSFRLLAARAGLAPARSLFIDDKSENVAAARDAGFRAEIFTGQRDLQALLAAEG